MAGIKYFFAFEKKYGEKRREKSVSIVEDGNDGNIDRTDEEKKSQSSLDETQARKKKSK